MFYFLISVTAFFSSVMSFWSASRNILILLLLLIPGSLQFSGMVYKNGMFITDGLMLGFFIYFIMEIVKHKSIKNKKNMIFLTIMFCIIIIYFLFFLLFSNLYLENFSESLKDFRPLIYITVIILSQIYFNNNSSKLSLEFLAIFSGVCCFFWLSMLSMGYFISDDIFYSQNNNRYLGVQSYFCLAYLVNYFSSKHYIKKKYDKQALFISFVAVFSTQSKMLIILALLIAFFGVLRQKRTSFLPYLVLTSLLFLSFTNLSRFEDLINVGLSDSMFHRVKPAITFMQDLTIEHMIIGHGFGELFLIDWFAYRDNINDYSVQLDNAYVTFFIKYGLIGFLYMFLLVNCLSKGNEKYLIAKFSILFMCLSSSFFYHMPSLGFYLFYAYRSENE